MVSTRMARGKAVELFRVDDEDLVKLMRIARPAGQCIDLFGIVWHGMASCGRRGVRPITAPDHAIRCHVDHAAGQRMQLGIVAATAGADQVAAGELDPGPSCPEQIK